MGLVTKGGNWRLDDKLWKRMSPLLPARKPHPLGCHNPRIPDRDAMNAILFVLHTGRDRHLLVQFGLSAFSGMDGSRGLRSLLAQGIDAARRTQGEIGLGCRWMER